MHLVARPRASTLRSRAWPGHGGVPAAEPKLMDKKKAWDKVAPGLRVDDGGVATWEGVAFGTSAGACTLRPPRRAAPSGSCRRSGVGHAACTRVRMVAGSTRLT